MAFPDPITITINAVSTPFNKTSETPTSTRYMNSDESVETLITQEVTKAGRRRRKVRMTTFAVVIDSLSGGNERESFTVEFILDEPENGFSDTEIGYKISALTSVLNDATSRGRLLTGQH